MSNKHKMTIPEIREELREMGVRLIELAEQTMRRPAVRRAPNKSAPLTHALRLKIRRLARINPEMSYKEIANLVGTNQGRVSEALAGKR